MEVEPNDDDSERNVSSEDDDDWETDEEQLVHVELSGFLQQGELGRPGLVTKFIGIEGPEPIVQLGSQVFAGKYVDTRGTSVFLKASPKTSDPDPVFSPAPDQEVEFFCKTNKKLLLKRVFLKDKSEEEENNRDDPNTRVTDSNESGEKNQQKQSQEQENGL